MELAKVGQPTVPANGCTPEAVERQEGWLYLVAVGIVIGPIRLLHEFVRGLIQPSRVDLDIVGANGPILGMSHFDIGGNLVQLCMLIWLAWSFLKKSGRVPQLFCTIAGYSMGLIMFEMLLFKLLFPTVALPTGAENLWVRMMLTSAIWIPCFLAHAGKAGRTGLPQG